MTVIEQAVAALTALKEKAGRCLQTEKDHEIDRINFENLKTWIEGIKLEEVEPND